MLDILGEAMDQGKGRRQGRRGLFLGRVEGLSVQMLGLQNILMMG